jgi:gliding motility-associated transport system ATP-binding protein
MDAPPVEREARQRRARIRPGRLSRPEDFCRLAAGAGVDWARFMNNGSMIEVASLTKRYAGHTAIEGLSFTVGRGEIVGLLGPNGAGKSTTMRILAGFLPASSGTARVAGFDVFTQSREVRRRLGYMPENNPLHQDMRVREYLRFRARLKGLSGRRSRARVDVVMEQCGLTKVGRQVIGQLSKGFRQRVGLADALVHEPELIILDEPTIGLDPNQIRAVRRLIKDLGGRHTVLISTHILPEVELTCHRVLIMHEGRILAADTPENLEAGMSDGRQVVAEIAAPETELRAALEAVDGVQHWNLSSAEGDYYRCALTGRAGLDLRGAVFELVHAHGWRLRELTAHRHSLEDIFVHMTRAPREEEEGF